MKYSLLFLLSNNIACLSASIHFPSLAQGQPCKPRNSQQYPVQKFVSHFILMKNHVKKKQKEFHLSNSFFLFLPQHVHKDFNQTGNSQVISSSFRSYKLMITYRMTWINLISRSNTSSGAITKSWPPFFFTRVLDLIVITKYSTSVQLKNANKASNNKR